MDTSKDVRLRNRLRNGEAVNTGDEMNVGGGGNDVDGKPMALFVVVVNVERRVHLGRK